LERLFAALLSVGVNETLLRTALTIGAFIMSDTKMSKGELTFLRLLVLVLSVIIAALLLKERPPLLPNVISFQKELQKPEINGAALIGRNGSLTVFAKNLDRVEPCGMSPDKPIPTNCINGLGNPIALNSIDILMLSSASGSNEAPALLISSNADDTQYTLICSDGFPGPPCHHHK
jgi:hypothetical protein